MAKKRGVTIYPVFKQTYHVEAQGPEHVETLPPVQFECLFSLESWSDLILISDVHLQPVIIEYLHSSG